MHIQLSTKLPLNRVIILGQQIIHVENMHETFKHYPQSMETGIAVEKLHLLCRKWS